MDRTESALNEETAMHESASEQIKQDIYGTRRSMDRTLDELGERLRPKELLEDLFELFRGSDAPAKGDTAAKVATTVTQLGRGLARMARENPVPSLLIGGGILWWMMENGEERTFSTPGSRSGSITDAAAGIAHRVGERSSDIATAAGETLANAAHQTGDAIAGATSSAWSGVKVGSEKVGERTREIGSHASDLARRGVERTREGVLQSAGYLRQTATDYPLAMGGASLAIGMLLGALLPSTRKEDEWMGDASDELKQEAKERGHEMLDRSREIAGDAVQRASEAAREQGFAPEQVGEKIREKVAEVGEATRGVAAQAAKAATSKLTPQTSGFRNPETEVAGPECVCTPATDRGPNTDPKTV